MIYVSIEEVSKLIEKVAKNNNSLKADMLYELIEVINSCDSDKLILNNEKSKKQEPISETPDIGNNIDDIMQAFKNKTITAAQAAVKLGTSTNNFYKKYKAYNSKKKIKKGAIQKKDDEKGTISVDKSDVDRLKSYLDIAFSKPAVLSNENFYLELCNKISAMLRIPNDGKSYPTQDINAAIAQFGIPYTITELHDAENDTVTYKIIKARG